MAEKGLVEFKTEGGDVYVERTTTTAATNGVSIQTAGDGLNTYQREVTPTQTTHELFIDAEKSEEIAEIAAAGTAVSAMAAAILSWSGVGTLAAPAAAVLAALLGYAGAQYATEAGNNGTITKLHMLVTGDPYGQIDS